MLEKLILKNLDSIIILKRNNKIIYYNKSLAKKLSNIKQKNNTLYYNNKYYNIKIKKIKINNKYLTLEIYNDITKEKKEFNNLENKVKELKKDNLTNLYNRHGIKDIYAYIENTKIPFSIIIGDIDYFKNINDTYGHNIGDNALIYISKILQSNIKNKNFICRYGGEEFLIILPNTNKKNAFNIAKKIKHILNTETFKINNNSHIKITMTFGISESNNKPIIDIINEADKALYIGKKNGRNTIKMYNENT